VCEPTIVFLLPWLFELFPHMSPRALSAQLHRAILSVSIFKPTNPRPLARLSEH
jgi:hypothetical protein